MRPESEQQARQEQPDCVASKRDAHAVGDAGQFKVSADAAEEGKGTKRHGEGFVAPHPGLELSSEGETPAEKADYMLHHPVYSSQYLESIQPIEYPATQASFLPEISVLSCSARITCVGLASTCIYTASCFNKRED